MGGLLPLDGAVYGAAKRFFRRSIRRYAPRREDLPLSTWRLSRDRSGLLSLDGFVLGELSERWGSPLHVVDGVRLAANADRFVARPVGAMRGCEVFCSYKTNPVPGLLRILHSRGLGAEVVSAYELWLALRLGVDPSRIVYNGPAKSEDSIVLALSREVGLINVNTRSEIALLASLARTMGKRPRVGIRVVAPGGRGGQFGERIETGAALEAFRMALDFPELEVVALDAHYNHELASRAQLDGFLSALLAFTDELHERLGLDLDILDIGGNLACPTVSSLSRSAWQLALTFGCDPVPRPPNSVLSIEAYVERVCERVERHYAARRRFAPRIFLEPGRALMGDAQTLLCRVLAVRDRDEDGTHWAVLDAGINIAEAVKNEFHQLFPLAVRAGTSERVYRLTGPSCTMGDLLYPAWRLPELAVGDGLAIMDSGAYFVPYATCFSVPRPGIVLVANGREDLIRRAETFDDLVALDANDAYASERQSSSATCH
jgi:diaminopimelate decarboxylase